jgi:hypothetical protein
MDIDGVVLHIPDNLSLSESPLLHSLLRCMLFLDCTSQPTSHPSHLQLFQSPYPLNIHTLEPAQPECRDWHSPRTGFPGIGRHEASKVLYARVCATRDGGGATSAGGEE